jgi:hypothetical protein
LHSEEVKKSKLNPENACYSTVQFSSVQLRKLCLPFSCVKTSKIKACKTVILPVVLYGCETWPLTLRKKHRLKVYGNRVLRKITGPKREEVAGSW